MRTDKDIADEIVALKKLKPIGHFKNKTASMIAAAIEELTWGIGQTGGEWYEMSMYEQDIVQRTAMWKLGHVLERPSSGFGKFVE